MDIPTYVGYLLIGVMLVIYFWTEAMDWRERQRLWDESLRKSAGDSGGSE